MVAFYALAVYFAFRRWRKGRPQRRWVSRLEWAVYGVALIGAICILYAYYVEPYWPQVTHVSLHSSKLPPGSHLRIVHFADLHSDGKVRLEKRLPGIIRDQHPDLITFAGDTVVRREGVPLAQEVFSQLSAIAPTYVVLGNWDVDMAQKWNQSFQDPSFFSGTGVHNLSAQADSIQIRGIPLWIAGAATNQEYLLPSLLATAPPDQYSILVFHFPDEVETVQQDKIDLYLAGHTHCGQIDLPFYGALITYSKYDKKYERGLHAIGNSWIYVNCGIGLEGHPPRARFLARPEITVIDLSSESVK